MKKRVGVIGSGAVGQALSKGFLKHGHDVMIGTNSVAKHKELEANVGGGIHIGSFEQTAKFGDLIVLAVKGTVAEAALNSAGVAQLKGKTIIDATNPIAETPPTNGVLHYFTSQNESLMERLQKLAPDANFVKAFSCVGNSFMVNPDFNGQKPTMFICGNDDSAKKEVQEILSTFGWDYENLGKIEASRAIEPLAILWCLPGFLHNEWQHAFKLLKK